ncbi:MAG: tripartite tricarboxylate transporter permease [Thermodesulfobacteriota bacterium]
MDTLSNIGLGLELVLRPGNLILCFLGCLFGTLVGVLPGFGPGAGVALLLPLTFKLPPLTGIIMLAGIFYGSMYGGSTTSILVNIPGEASSVITCLDGYQMARQGRAGPALGISAFGSFIAGTVGTIILMFLAPPLGELAIRLGPPDFFAIMVLGLSLIAYLSRFSVLKSFIMAVAGLFAGTIGIDQISGEYRFTYGSFALYDGLGFVPVAIGMFGMAEVIENLEGSLAQRDIFKTRIRGLFPTLKDWKDSSLPIIRGTLIGFFCGILPGPSATIASFASYAVEKKLSRHPQLFGTGIIEGVAGPESANNAATSGAFIPMLSLGIPISVVTAMLLAALMIHGITPGPFLISEHPDIFWGFIMSMYIGNIMLMVLNLPLIGLWVQVVKIPYTLLAPLIILFCLIGVYVLNNSIGEIFIMIFFSFFGYVTRKHGFEGAPFLMGLILGPMMEKALRQSLLYSRGSFSIFLEGPICPIFLLMAFLILGSSILAWLKKRKRAIAAILSE